MTAQGLSQLSSSVQGVCSDEGGRPGVQPQCYPLADRAEGESRQQEQGAPSTEERAPFSLQGLGAEPLLDRATSHISHLIPELCIFWLSFFLFFLFLFFLFLL